MGTKSYQPAQSEASTTHLETVDVSYRSPRSWPDRYHDGPRGDFHVDGTEPHELAAHITLAGRWRKAVKACVTQRRCGWAADPIFPAQGQGSGSDGTDRSDYRYSGSRSGRLLDPPLAARRWDRKSRCRPRLDCNVAPASTGEN